MNIQNSFEKIDVNYDYKCQIIIIGDSTVGKTSLLFQYNNQPNPLKQVATVGIDYFTRDVNIEGKLIRTKIWDTAGQERFRSITDNFFKNANGIILVFDLNCRETFHNLKTWIQTIKLKVPNHNIKKILIGNKSDLKREVSTEEGLEFSKNFMFDYFETSVKQNINIHESINHLITNVYHTGELEKNTSNLLKDKKDKKGGCCK